MLRGLWLFGLTGMLFAGACSQDNYIATNPTPVEAKGSWNTLTGEPPIIIAHRGASGYLPEHTLEAYSMAIAQGADFIEPDLVITKDGHLIARHDRYLSTTTNVADLPEFADRKTLKAGRAIPDWYAEDFTLEEIKQLRARQPFKGRTKQFDDQFEIPTFSEVLALANDRSATLGKRVGVYPETKQPTALEKLGLSFDDALIYDLKATGYEGADAPVYIQSFEPEILKRLDKVTETELIFLTFQTPTISFSEIAQFADGIGPYKELLLSEDGQSTGMVEAAHAAGLEVHPWTFRMDALGSGYETFTDEVSDYLALGVDGVFTDFPDAAITVRAR